MKILLVNPPRYEVVPKEDSLRYTGDFYHSLQPAALLRIGTVLKRKGIDVSMFDFFGEELSNQNIMLEKRRFRKYLLAGIPGQCTKEYPSYALGHTQERFMQYLTGMNKPDEIWISTSMTYYIEAYRDTIISCKAVYPDVKVVLGGIFATLCSDAAYSIGADKVVAGELTEANFVNSDLSLLTYKADYAVIKTTRGCPNNCSYCAVSHLEGKRHKFRDPLETFQEMKEKNKKYGIREFIFYESNVLINNKHHLSVLLDLIIDEGLDFNLKFPEGFPSNLLDEDIIIKLAKAGLDEFRLSLESSDIKMLRRFQRPIAINDFVRCLELMENNGIQRHNIGVFILAGLLGQRFESVLDSIVYVWDTGCRPMIMEFTPIPGSKEYELGSFTGRPLETLHPLLFPCARSDHELNIMERYDLFHLSKEPSEILKNMKSHHEIYTMMVPKMRQSDNLWDIYISSEPEGLFKEDVLHMVLNDAMMQCISGDMLLVGCGTGEAADYLASLGYDVYGIDRSKSAIRSLKSKCKYARRCNFSAESIFSYGPKRMFDTIIDMNSFSMQLQEELVDYLARVSSLLKTDGHYILRCCAAAGISVRKPFKSEADATMCNFVTHERLLELLGWHFTVVHHEYSDYVLGDGGSCFIPSMENFILAKKKI